MAAETRYYDGKKVRTATELEQDFKKARLIAGQTAEGAEYVDALNAWLSTHTTFTAKDQRSLNAAIITFAVTFGVFALIAIITLMSGAVIAAIVLLVVGGVVGFIFAGVVTILTTGRAQR